nr:hypothetical protein [Tanacetum cinerariifolium]
DGGRLTVVHDSGEGDGGSRWCDGGRPTVVHDSGEGDGGSRWRLAH